MKSKRSVIYLIVISFTFLLCILDSRTVINGARNGLDLCFNSAIPSLFPFLIISKILCSLYQGHSPHFLTQIGRALGIPNGAEHLLINSVFGGYPVGAQSIYDMYTQGSLTKSTAKRLLSFCNNAGPAFIFGIISGYFSSPLIPWLIWLIHVASSVLVGLFFPNKKTEIISSTDSSPMNIINILHSSIQSIAMICGWIIIFRIIIQIAQKWILGFIPQPWNTLIIGTLELSNGCFMLSSINNESWRFIVACVLVSFGGCCVWMQTASVVKELGTRFYFQGKILQTGFSLLFAITIQHLIYKTNHTSLFLTLGMILVLILLGMFILKRCILKKTVAI